MTYEYKNITDIGVVSTKGTTITVTTVVDTSINASGDNIGSYNLQKETVQNTNPTIILDS